MTEAAQPARSLRFPQPDDVFQLRVSLLGIKPPIWRRVLARQDVKLPQLHAILQIVMGWTNSHLHQFKVGDVVFAQPDQEYDEPGPIDYRRITLNQIAPRRSSTCIYEYDFGDSWDHLITVEDELPIETVRGPVPRCLEGERACPPEDCGGAYGYADLLKALRNPRHPEHDGSVEWVGPDFDPERFDLERVNDGLARLAVRPRGATPRAERTTKRGRRRR